MILLILSIPYRMPQPGAYHWSPNGVVVGMQTFSSSDDVDSRDSPYQERIEWDEGEVHP